MALQACLGLTLDGARGEVRIVDPRLPVGIDRLWIDGLEVAGETISLFFERHGDRIRVTSEARAGVVRVLGPVA